MSLVAAAIRRPTHAFMMACVCLLLGATSSANAEEREARYSRVMTTRLFAQQQMGQWLSEVLSELVRPDTVLVTVEIALEGQLRKIVDKEVRPPVNMQLGVQRKVKLPGLPNVERSLGAPGLSVKLPGSQFTHFRDELDSVVQRIKLRLFLGTDMPDSRVKEISELAAVLAGVEPKRGDSVEVTRLSSLDANIGLQDSRFPTGMVLLVCATFFLSCLMLAFALSRRQASGVAKVVGEMGSAAPARDSPEAADAIWLDEDDEGAPRVPKLPRAFACLSGTREGELVQVLALVGPRTAAVVLDLLNVSPVVQQRLFETLSSEQQVQLARELGKTKVMQVGEIAELERSVETALSEVRSKIAVGSENRLAALLENAPEGSRGLVLAELVQQEPELHEAVRARMMIFDDIAHLPKETVRQIVGELDPSVTAMALREAPGPVRQAVMNAVSRRLAAILSAEEEGLPASNGLDAERARRAMETAMRRLCRLEARQKDV